MAKAKAQSDDYTISQKSEWYQVEASEQIAFYRNKNTGSIFYITDSHEGRLRPSGEKYAAVYVDREEDERSKVNFDSPEKVEDLESLEEFTVSEMAERHLN